jgi:Protein of unknown function (DUF3618)
MAPKNDETHVLRDDIRETRERMSETLDQLGDRLNPQRLKVQAKESIKEATIGRVTNMANSAGNTVVDTVRDNPIPAALVGIGLGWLIYNRRRVSDLDRYRARSSMAYRGDITARTPRLRQDDAAGGIGASISPIDEPNAVQRGTQRVSETVGDVTDRVGERVSELTDRAQDIAQDVVETTRYQARRLEHRFQDTLSENPLAVGMAAVAVGLAAGLAIPESRKESELMGEARDRLVERVREKAEEVGEKVQRVAERAVDEVSASAREEGLSR